LHCSGEPQQPQRSTMASSERYARKTSASWFARATRLRVVGVVAICDAEEWLFVSQALALREPKLWRELRLSATVCSRRFDRIGFAKRHVVCSSTRQSNREEKR
jgi:hypothetical protein